jgi:hypothetical protein
VTVIPGAGFEDRCTRSGPPSSLNLDDGIDHETIEIVSICELLEKLTPEIGSGRVESAEYITRANTNCVELVAGECAEMILHPESPPLDAVHDHTEARAFARVACAMPSAVTALIAYAEAEAKGLLLENIGCLRALVAALDVRGTLCRDEVDEIIVATLAAEGIAIEKRRRDDWQRRQHQPRGLPTEIIESATL